VIFSLGAGVRDVDGCFFEKSGMVRWPLDFITTSSHLDGDSSPASHSICQFVRAAATESGDTCSSRAGDDVEDLLEERVDGAAGQDAAVYAARRARASTVTKASATTNAGSAVMTGHTTRAKAGKCPCVVCT
jgi:hypothetical protein